MGRLGVAATSCGSFGSSESKQVPPEIVTEVGAHMSGVRETDGVLQAEKHGWPCGPKTAPQHRS